MTNLEKIRYMSANEIAAIFYDLSNYGEYCAIPKMKCSCAGYEDCEACCEAWLEMEANDE